MEANLEPTAFRIEPRSGPTEATPERSGSRSLGYGREREPHSVTVDAMLTDHSLPNLRHFRVFESAAERRSVNQAASAQHLSQPAVTYAVKQIEEFFAVPLFVRRRSGSYLTPMGEIVYPRVQRVLGELEAAAVDAGVQSSQLGRVVARITNMHIRAHLAIAEDPVLPPGGECFGVSGAALHRAARELEHIVNAPLYEMTSDGKRLTELGRNFTRRFRLAMREIEYAFEEISAAAGRLQTRIKVGTARISTTKILAVVFEELHRVAPAARLEVIEDTYAANLERLRCGSVDFIFSVLSGAVGAEDVTRIPLFFNPYVVAARRRHPLTKKKSITLDDLAKYEWVSTQPLSPRRIAIEALFGGRDPPPVYIETTSRSVHRSVLLASDRLSLMTKHDDFLDDGGPLIVLDVDVNVSRPPEGLTIRKDWVPSASQRLLMDLFNSVAASVG